MRPTQKSSRRNRPPAPPDPDVSASAVRIAKQTAKRRLLQLAGFKL
jgi:hypothetical protein